MKATKNGLAIQITTDENEKQKEKLAADQFFSSLLGGKPKRATGANRNWLYAPRLFVTRWHFVKC